MSRPAEAKKIKSYLGSVREYLSKAPPPPRDDGDRGEGDDPTTTTTNIAHLALLGSELAQRGVAPPPLPSPSSSDAGTTTSEAEATAAASASAKRVVAEAVRSAAGRPLLLDVGSSSSGGLPKPLLAACAAVAAMAAERCADLCDDESLGRTTPPLPATSTKSSSGGGTTSDDRSSPWDDASSRCEEVGDVRFRILLRLAAAGEGQGDGSGSRGDDGAGGGSGDQKEAARTVVLRPRKATYLRIAYGNYLRAASEFSEPDQPRMWKGALDAARRWRAAASAAARGGAATEEDGATTGDDDDDYLHRTRDASWPLSNLIRVARSRGNDSRAGELSLRLAECLVEGALDDDDDGGGGGAAGGGEGEVDASFVDPYRDPDEAPPPPQKKGNAAVARWSRIRTDVDRARDALSGCTPAETSTLRFRVASYRTEATDEESTVRHVAEGRFDAAKRRVSEDASIETSAGSGSGGGVFSEKKASSKKAVATTTTTTVPSKESFVATVRAEFLTGAALGDDGDDAKGGEDRGGAAVDDAGAALRDAVLSTPTVRSGPGGGGAVEDDALELLRSHVDRLVERARAIGLSVAAPSKGGTRSQKPTSGRRTEKDRAAAVWDAARDFATPFPLRCRHDAAVSVVPSSADEGGAADLDAYLSSLSESGRSLVESSAETIVAAAWMNPRDARSDDDDAQSTEAASSVLAACLRLRSSEEDERRERKARAGDAAVEDDGPSKRDRERIISIECADSAARCRLALARTGAPSPRSDDDDDARTAALEAVRLCKKADPSSSSLHRKSYATSVGRFGTAHLQLLVAWGGMHRPPWSHCTVEQARSIVRGARRGAETSRVDWGRDPRPSEAILLDVAEADAEGGTLPGGSASTARGLYDRALSEMGGIATDETATDETASADSDAGGMWELLRAHCLAGLSRLALLDGGASSAAEAESLARSSLEAVVVAADVGRDGDASRSAPSFGPWTPPTRAAASSRLLCASRLLVAESLLRSSKPGDAEAFLGDAASDAPDDPDAALALGSFRLRRALRENGGGTTASAASAATTATMKSAKAQLLRAAKLDAGRSDPFALLGIWHEVVGDDARAAKCHLRALGLDPCHPVAGRGILRLRPRDEATRDACEAAAAIRASSANGWAWRAIGKAKSARAGGGGGEDDEAAAECYQKALRCRDVANARNEVLGAFYRDPTARTGGDGSDGGGGERDDGTAEWECGEVWSELASSYRRLGKYSACVRAYERADEASGGDLPPDVLCSWAQVELDLGLHDDAADKFERVLSAKKDVDPSSTTTTAAAAGPSRPIAAYGLGTAMLSVARRDAEEGKMGSALDRLHRGVEALRSGLLIDGDVERPTSPHACALKLLGDLHSFGGRLPPDLFVAEGTDAAAAAGGAAAAAVRSQVSFVARGEAAYRAALVAVESGSGGAGSAEDRGALVAAAACDLGTNVLLQAKLLSSSSLGEEGSGGGGRAIPTETTGRRRTVRDLLDESTSSFLRAVDADPHASAAWCGLGCASAASDPLAAQHAFCRSVQLDRSCPDAWANLGLMYADAGSASACAEALDALTQVADTPLMWIGRALMLERTAGGGDGSAARGVEAEDANLCHAADAYRAALQVSRNPDALLGLALTCRRLGLGGGETGAGQPADYVAAAERAAAVACRDSLSIYLRATGGQNVGARLIAGVLAVEEGSERLTRRRDVDGKEKLRRGIGMIEEGIELTSSLERSGEVVESTALEGEVFKKKRDAAGGALQLSAVAELADLSAKFADDLDRWTAGLDAESSSPSDRLSESRRKVRLFPENGEHWLRFAKDLTRESLSLQGSSENGQPSANASLENSKIAASRSVSLLRDQLVRGKYLIPRRLAVPVGDAGMNHRRDVISHKPVLDEPVDGTSFAEALALSHWVQEELKEGDAAGATSTVNLQRALMVDPENSMGRSVLESLAT